MTKALLLLMIFTLCEIRAEESSTTLPSETTLGKLLRQARSEYYQSKYEADGSSVTSGAIGIRGEPEHRDAAYYESRCITCDLNKSALPDIMWGKNPRHDYRDDIDEYMRRHRDNDYADKPRNEYERPRGGSTYDNYRPSNLPFDYDRMRGPSLDYDHNDPYKRIFIPPRPLPYSDRYDIQSGRDYYNNDMRYERNYDRYSERGNGYDNSDPGYLTNVNRYDPYNSQRRPIDDPSMYPRYDGFNNNNSYMKYDPYDKYEPYDRDSYRKPYDDRRDRYDRYERYPFRGGPNSRGYFNSGLWGPGGERGYPSSTLNYGGGYRDNWREPGKEREPNDHWKDLNRDREVGPYRPRDYYDGSTTQPGGPRGTSYHYDRPESSTKPDLPERDKPTNSPQTQDNKAYKD